METNFRAEGAKNLVQEFQTYGYPLWVLKLTGIAKFGFSGMLILSLITPCKEMTMLGALGMVFLMVVAVASHIKVGDALSNNGAAVAMLVFSLIVLGAQQTNSAADLVTPYDLPVGLVCACACLAMFARSFMNGDYDLDNYEKISAREPFLQIV